MNWLEQLWARRQAHRDLNEEIQEHIDEKTEELVRSGMARSEAAAAARRQFGNTILQAERGREVWQWPLIDGLFRDARFALRQLRRNPGFSFTVILTLTLAIGANTAVFSMVSALLLRPLPYREPHRLLALERHVWGIAPDGQRVDEFNNGQDGETWDLLRDRVPAVECAAYSYGFDGVNLEAEHQVRYVRDHRVSAEFFDVLGIKPLLGRSFTKDEDRPKGPNAAILSYDLWQSVYQGNRAILGQSIRVKGEPYTVVGVMPPEAVEIFPAELWLPLRPERGGEGEGTNYHVVMRLRESGSLAQVNAQLQPVRPAAFDRYAPGEQKQLVAHPLQANLAREKRGSTLLLMAAVALILLIAAANLAGLILVRLARRTQEITTRMALGAPRIAIIRQAVMEPLLLTLMGSASGLMLSFFSLKSFATLFPRDMIAVGGIHMDGRVLLFCLLCAVGCALFTGIFPALATRGAKLQPSLSGRSTLGHAGSGRTRNVLIGAEVCLTLLLLAGAGLLVRTLVYLQTLPAGFDPSNMLAASASLDDIRYRDPAVFQKLIRESLVAMKQIPGVTSAAVGLSLPYERGLNTGFEVIDGTRAGTKGSSSATYITPEYFSTLRIPVLAGRTFTEADTKTSEPVTLVNVSFAREHLGTTDVVGRHLRIDGTTKVTIVGLTGDVKKQPGIEGDGPLTTEPVYYVPFTQVNGDYLGLVHQWFAPSWMVRWEHPIVGLPEEMQSALGQIEPNLPFAGFRSMSALQAQALSQQRAEVLLLTVLASLALLLSMLGIYGLVSHMVVQRRREIGIRMALGCALPRAMAEVARSGMVATILGLLCGLALSLLALRAISSELYGVRSLDPLTMVSASFLLLLAAAAASFAPTRKIARIDPAASLRSE